MEGSEGAVVRFENNVFPKFRNPHFYCFRPKIGMVQKDEKCYDDLSRKRAQPLG